MLLKHICLAASALALTACSPVSVLNGITPSGSYTKTSDISYGDLDRQKLDIYKADKPREGAPVLVFIHGGGWQNGDKSMYKFLAEGFTSEGFDIVVPNYRLHPDAKYPSMLVDSAKAVAFTAEQFETRPLVLMGHSAGAYNAVMMGLDTQFARDAGVEVCNRVAGIVSLAAPTGVVPLVKEPYITVFPDKFTGMDAAVNNVTAPAPPMFLLSGDADETVYPRNINDLHDAVQARSGASEKKLYAGMTHNDAVKFLSRYFDEDSTQKADILKFIGGLPQSGPYCR